MAEIAGLVLGAVALWRSCVQVFEVIDSSRGHGMEYEIMLVKIEVERVRLEKRGDTISFGDLERNNEELAPGSPPLLSDSLLRRRNVIEVVERVLGCIQHIFDNTQRLE
jgi:hypothetical protein